jgi:hypothetical protein
MVELNAGFADETEGAPSAPSVLPEAAPEPVSQVGDQAEGVRIAARLLRAPAARWPMYVRNVKQLLRAGSFDERQYGFGGLMDLLRACQRENILRLERDRRGGLRAFQGTALGSASQTAQPLAPVDVAEAADMGAISDVTAVDPIAGELAVSTANPIEEAEVVDIQPREVVDTTAELLGRAKPKRPRTSRSTRKTEEKATPSRRTRQKRAAS